MNYIDKESFTAKYMIPMRYKAGEGILKKIIYLRTIQLYYIITNFASVLFYHRKKSVNRRR